MYVLRSTRISPFNRRPPGAPLYVQPMSRSPSPAGGRACLERFGKVPQQLEVAHGRAPLGQRGTEYHREEHGAQIFQRGRSRGVCVRLFV